MESLSFFGSNTGRNNPPMHVLSLMETIKVLDNFTSSPEYDEYAMKEKCQNFLSDFKQRGREEGNAAPLMLAELALTLKDRGYTVQATHIFDALDKAFPGSNHAELYATPDGLKLIADDKVCPTPTAAYKYGTYQLSIAEELKKREQPKEDVEKKKDEGYQYIAMAVDWGHHAAFEIILSKEGIEKPSFSFSALFGKSNPSPNLNPNVPSPIRAKHEDLLDPFTYLKKAERLLSKTNVKERRLDDIEEAKKLLKKAADLKQKEGPKAVYDLAERFFKSPQKISEALLCYEIAGLNGHKEAREKFEKLNGDREKKYEDAKKLLMEGKLEQAVPYLLSAVKHNHVGAVIMLAEMYQNEHLHQQDPNFAKNGKCKASHPFYITSDEPENKVFQNLCIAAQWGNKEANEVILMLKELKWTEKQICCVWAAKRGDPLAKRKILEEQAKNETQAMIELGEICLRDPDEKSFETNVLSAKTYFFKAVEKGHAKKVIPQLRKLYQKLKEEFDPELIQNDTAKNDVLLSTVDGYVIPNTKADRWNKIHSAFEPHMEILFSGDFYSTSDTEGQKKRSTSSYDSALSFSQSEEEKSKNLSDPDVVDANIEKTASPEKMSSSRPVKVEKSEASDESKVINSDEKKTPSPGRVSKSSRSGEEKLEMPVERRVFPTNVEKILFSEKTSSSERSEEEGSENSIEPEAVSSGQLDHEKSTVMVESLVNSNVERVASPKKVSGFNQANGERSEIKSEIEPEASVELGVVSSNVEKTASPEKGLRLNRSDEDKSKISAESKIINSNVEKVTSPIKTPSLSQPAEEKLGMQVEPETNKVNATITIPVDNGSNPSDMNRLEVHATDSVVTNSESQQTNAIEEVVAKPQEQSPNFNLQPPTSNDLVQYSKTESTVEPASTGISATTVIAGLFIIGVPVSAWTIYKYYGGKDWLEEFVPKVQDYMRS